MARKITKNQKDFSDKFLETGNGTKSALEVYDTKNENVAAVIASENLRKPKVIEYLEGNALGASSRIVKISKTAKNEAVKLSANKDILDRAGFKPTDKTELSGMLQLQQVTGMKVIKDNEKI